jgi:F-type H+-transporting ATPase subunit c
MKRYILMLVTALVGLLVAAPAFAQTPAGAEAPDQKWIWITAGFAMAIAAGPCGYAQSKVAAAACEGLARNPGARPGIQLAMLLGLVFIETLALFTFAMIFAKVKVG